MFMFMYIYENMNLFDFSDYPEDWKLLDLVNKKEIGKMKDEVKKKKKINEFLGLKSKIKFFSYSK